MKRAQLLLTVVTMALSLVISACNSGKSGGGSAGGGGTSSMCQAGQVWIQQYNGCFSTAQCPSPPNPVNSGFVPQVNQCIVGVPGGGGTTATNQHMWSGNLVITNLGPYQQLMKDNAICGVPYNSGYYDCAYWEQYASFQLDMYGNSMPGTGLQTRASIISYQNTSYYYRITAYNGLGVPADQNTTIRMGMTGVYTGYNDIFGMIARPAIQPVPYSDLKKITQMRVDLFYNGSQFGFSDVTLRW